MCTNLRLFTFFVGNKKIQSHYQTIDTIIIRPDLEIVAFLMPLPSKRDFRGTLAVEQFLLLFLSCLSSNLRLDQNETENFAVKREGIKHNILYLRMLSLVHCVEKDLLLRTYLVLLCQTETQTSVKKLFCSITERSLLYFVTMI